MADLTAPVIFELWMRRTPEKYHGGTKVVADGEDGVILYRPRRSEDEPDRIDTFDVPDAAAVLAQQLRDSMRAEGASIESWDAGPNRVLVSVQMREVVERLATTEFEATVLAAQEVERG